MSDDQYPLSGMETRYRIDHAQDASAKTAVGLSVRPSEVLVGLGFVLPPSVGVVPADLLDREPIYRSAVDLHEGLQGAGRTTKGGWRGIGRAESPLELADVETIERAFSDQTAAE
jgi:hypothetical protein